MGIIIFIISLAILILVHEFGHFIVAKKSGIRVDEFGLGFPPKLWSKRVGETLYTLNAIPFGGFVKIFGEDPHSGDITPENKSRSMFYKPKWVQALVLVAGVTFNIIFAWLLISLGFMIGLPSPVEHSGFGQVRDAHVVVTSVLPKSPAEIAGLRTGDTIVFVAAGTQSLQDETLTPEKISNLVKDSTDSNIDILYRRGDTQPVVATVEPNTTVVSGRRAIGISMENIGTLKLSVPLALVEGAHTTALLIKNTVTGLAGFLWSIVTFTSDFSQVSGPIGIAGVVGQAKTLGFVYLLSLIALISVNLAVINLVPFPALDGGRLFMILIEVIIRRPINPKIVQWVNAVGFVLLIILMVIISGHDIIRLL
ncbi:MAG: site-2 protease family protein [Patescibacteria group bacterium]